MARIEQSTIDRILDTARIEEVVGDFVDLKKRGIRYLGLCPFHDDHHIGSFVVYPRGNCYKCFACDSAGGVVDFVMRHERLSFPDAIRWLGRKYGIDTDTEDFRYTPPPPRPAPPPLPMLTLPMQMVTSREDTRDDLLVRWLRTLNFDSVQRRRLDEVLRAYHVGHSRTGMTIWWQIDEQQRVRTGKMMRYGADGHRDKKTGYNFDFIHSALFRDQHFPQWSDEKQELKQCLFGLHLLDKYKREGIGQTVCLVESEKTAVIMAIAYGNHTKQVWMACGGLENLTAEKLQPIIRQGRRIVLYPDRDGIERWRAKAAAVGYDRMAVDVRPVTEWWREADGAKADIADVVVRMISERRSIGNKEEVGRLIPAAKTLIDRYDCDIVE